MNRRDMMKSGTVALIAATIPSLAASPGMAFAKQTVSTGGIGLSRQSWEQEHGRGEAGQNVVSYENDAYNLQYAGDIVVYLELGWEDRSGISGDEAETVTALLIPSDAELREVYYAPPTAAGPIGMRTERYHSPALADLMKQVDSTRTGGIQVIYQETAAEDRFEPNVLRISYSVGSKPHSILDEKSGFVASFA